MRIARSTSFRKIRRHHYHGSDFNEENLKKCIDVAAAVGLETFILDYGWAEIAGKWFPKAEWFPRGLDPLPTYARLSGARKGSKWFVSTLRTSSKRTLKSSLRKFGCGNSRNESGPAP